MKQMYLEIHGAHKLMYNQEGYRINSLLIEKK